jgi:hypothetical protein
MGLKHALGAGNPILAPEGTIEWRGGLYGYGRPNQTVGSIGRLAHRSGIMQSPKPLTCRPQRPLGVVTLHNRALRIIHVLRFTAKRGVRKGDSPGTRPCRLSARPPERPTLRSTTHGGPPCRPGTEALSCWHRQSGNRPPAANRARLRAPHPGSEGTVAEKAKPPKDFIRVDCIHNGGENRERIPVI